VGGAKSIFGRCGQRFSAYHTMIQVTFAARDPVGTR
jgi:hypothetical protein